MKYFSYKVGETNRTKNMFANISLFQVNIIQSVIFRRVCFRLRKVYLHCILNFYRTRSFMRSHFYKHTFQPSWRASLINIIYLLGSFVQSVYHNKLHFHPSFKQRIKHKKKIFLTFRRLKSEGILSVCAAASADPSRRRRRRRSVFRK